MCQKGVRSVELIIGLQIIKLASSHEITLKLYICSKRSN